jgi:hypothetical protein
MNPDYFAGTVLESDAAALLRQKAPAGLRA